MHPKATGSYCGSRAKKVFDATKMFMNELAALI